MCEPGESVPKALISWSLASVPLLGLITVVAGFPDGYVGGNLMEPKTKILLELPDTLLAELDEKAKAEDRPRVRLIREAIRRYLGYAW